MKPIKLEYKTYEELKEELGNKYDTAMYEINLSALKEIERLNNIINELEKELKEDYKIWMCNSRSNGKSVKFGIDVCKTHFYNRLQELKGVDKE